MTKEAYYFSHDSNARHDPKMVRLLREYGHEAYGIYWMIIEMMRDENTYRIEADPSLIAYAIRYENDLSPMLDRMVELGLFEVDETGLSSPSLDRRMALRNARKKAGKKGGKGRSKANPKQTPSKTQANSKQNASKSEAPASSLLEANLKPKGKERKGKEIKVNTTSSEVVARATAFDPVSEYEEAYDGQKLDVYQSDLIRTRCTDEEVFRASLEYWRGNQYQFKSVPRFLDRYARILAERDAGVVANLSGDGFSGKPKAGNVRSLHGRAERKRDGELSFDEYLEECGWTGTDGEAIALRPSRETGDGTGVRGGDHQARLLVGPQGQQGQGDGTSIGDQQSGQVD